MADGEGMHWGKAVRPVSLVLIVAGTLSILRHLPVEPSLRALGGWLTGLGAWGPVAFGLIYVAAVVLMVPASPLTLAAGAIFGTVVGTVTVAVASNVGAALAFLIARHVARDAVAARARSSPRFGAVDRAVGEGGWKVVALLRLSPAVPFNVQNYVYGLTRIGFWPCVLTSAVAMLPATFLYVYLGHVGRAGLEAAAGSGRSRTPAEWALTAVGLLATAAVTAYVTRLATRAVRDRSEPDPAGTEEPAPSVPGPRRAVVTAAFAAVALAVVSAAAAVELRPGLIRSAASALFGLPPAVDMKEAYANDPEGPAFDHGEFDALLREHVSPAGRVDYRGLLGDRARLDGYLGRLADAPFDALGRDEKLALLINAYNAFTLRLILEHYPVDSILSVPQRDRWDAVRWRVGPHVWSLSRIEHGEIRPNFRDPRVHFALVCGAVGCPPLRAGAYDADRLDAQLEDQARYVHGHDRWFRWDGRGSVGLTPIYDWYAGDFGQVAGSSLDYAARYVPALAARLKAGDRPGVRWLDYDWSLNGRKSE